MIRLFEPSTFGPCRSEASRPSLELFPAMIELSSWTVPAS